MQKGITIFRWKICLAAVPKNFVGEPFCAVFQKISGSEKFMDKRGEGRVSRFSVEKFLSHSAEKLRRGTLLCFRKFLVSKKFMDKRGGEYKDFPLKFFVSQCQKIS